MAASAGPGYTSVIDWKLDKKLSFPLKISLVTVTKSAVSCWFGHVYWRNHQWKTSFFVQGNMWINVCGYSLQRRIYGKDKTPVSYVI